MAHMKREFDRLIAAQINISRSTFTKERINQHIARYEYANTTTGIKDKREIELLSRYDVVKVDGIKRLIKKGSHPYRFYCNTDELYELLKTAHIECNHGGEKKIMRLLSHKYANITINQIKMFKSICDVCKAKKCKTEDTVEKWESTISERFGNRGHVNTIDFKQQPNRGYSYVLYYYDHKTRFNSLRPLHSTEPAEIAVQLFDVFSIFGVPRILHSNNGKEFVRKIINELCTLWPKLLIVEGRAINTETVNEAIAAVVNEVRKWTLKYPHVGWSDSLRFIQFSLNNKFNESTLITPFKALFNQDPIIGLNQDIPPSILNKTRPETEEELDAILASNSNQEDLSEAESPIEDQGRIKIEAINQDYMTETESSILDTLPTSHTNSFSTGTKGPQLQCKICREYIITDVQICVKCNSQVHDLCTISMLSLPDKQQRILCKWCIEGTLPDINNTAKNKIKRKGDKNRDLDSKKTKNMGFEELCPTMYIEQIKSGIQIPGMLSTFDTDDQPIPNDAMSSLPAQDMSSSQFELNDIFDSNPL